MTDMNVDRIVDMDMEISSGGTIDMDISDEGVGGSVNYITQVYNKPKVNGVVLEEDKSLEELGDKPLSNLEIKQIFDRVFNP